MPSRTAAGRRQARLGAVAVLLTVMVVAGAPAAAWAAFSGITVNVGSSWATAATFGGSLYTWGEGKAGQTGGIDLSANLAPRTVGAAIT